MEYTVQKLCFRRIFVYRSVFSVFFRWRDISQISGFLRGFYSVLCKQTWSPFFFETGFDLISSTTFMPSDFFSPISGGGKYSKPCLGGGFVSFYVQTADHTIPKTQRIRANWTCPLGILFFCAKQVSEIWPPKVTKRHTLRATLLMYTYAYKTRTRTHPRTNTSQ